MDGNIDSPRPDASSEPILDANMSAPRALLAVTRACIQQIRANEPVLLDGRSPEALHQIRIALRRWRTALSVFREVAPDDGAILDAELKALAKALNEARDLDVFAAALARRSPSNGISPLGLKALEAALGDARSQAHAHAAEAMGAERTRRLLWEGARAVEGLATVPIPETPTARDMAAKSLSKRRRQIRKHGRRVAQLAPDERHWLRIRSKKARYACELLGGLFGHPRRQDRMIKVLKRLQDSLGELNDIHVGEKIAARLAVASGVPEAAFVAGMVAGARAGGEEVLLLDAAAKAYDRFEALHPFW